MVHDWNALGTPHCTFANGLAKPASPPSAAPFFELPVLLLPPNKLSVFGSEMFPNPAFRSASLVPKELSIFLFIYFFPGWTWFVFGSNISKRKPGIDRGGGGEMGEDQAQVGSLPVARRVGRG